MTAPVACKAFAAGDCAQLALCVPTVLNVFGFASDSDCASRLELMCLDDLAAPGANLTPELFAADAALFQSMTCEEIDANLSYHPTEYPVGCGGPGTLADGKGCFASAQCASQNCAIANNTLCGTCLTPTLGTACTGMDDCGAKFWCHNGQCEPRAALGAPCMIDWGCVFGAYCAPTGTCAPRLSQGAACTGDDDCQSPLICGANGLCKHPAWGGLGASCDVMETSSCAPYNGLKCDASTHVCVSDPSPGPGEPCGSLGSDGGAPYVLFCSGGAKCAVDSSLKGICVVSAADGAKCGTTTSPFCTIPAQCVGGVCTLPNATTCPPN